MAVAKWLAQPIAGCNHLAGMVSFTMVVSQRETRNWWLRHCWRGFACASLLFLAPLWSASADIETRFFRIGTAPTGGTFFEIGAVVASAISSPVEGAACPSGGDCGVPGLVAVAQATQGSMENLRLVASGQIESGFVQADLAAMAYAGTGGFAEDGPQRRLRAIASLFPEALQIVVRVDSSIRSVADLAGKTVAVGDQGSGTAAIVGGLFTAAGFGDDDVVRKYVRPAQAAEEMKAGTVDAMILAGSYPVPAIQELAAAVPVRLVPVSGAVAARLEAQHQYFGSAVIPAGTYRNVDTDTGSVGFSALWIVRDDADEELIHDITRAAWSDAASQLYAGLDPIGRQIKLANALRGMALPLHPGAARFYREQGLPLEELPVADPSVAPSR
jgi:TRAP transporter TAXI family solute receptor